MTSKEELEKMTVAQIKEKLKSKRLPISGAKSELINRLYESLVAEEKLLEGPGGDGDDIDFSNVDEVLGLDDDKDTVSSASDQKHNDSLLGSPSNNNKCGAEKTAQNTLSSPTTKLISAGSPITAKKSPVGTMAAAKPKIGAQSEKGTAETANETADQPKSEQQQQPIAAEKKVQLKMAARLGVPLAESEAKAKRSARFNTAGTTTTTTKDGAEMKAKRAARFGTVAGEAKEEEEGIAVKRKIASEEDGKMLKRAERFGLPLKRGATDNSNKTAGGGDDLLQKRAKRFGMSVDSGVEQESKKVERAKRFGLTS